MNDERIKGLVPCSVNFEVNKTAPLDSRTVVATVLGLTQTDTWAVNGKVWLYDGIVVAVKENNGLYMLKGFSKDPLAYTSADNWIRLDGAAVDKLEVVNNITSTDATKALAAAQGKVLSDKIEELKTSLSAALNYKGSVANFAALPTNAAKGDVYNVVAANGTTPAGTNYAWNGTEWDALGGAVDLSGYYTKAETDSAIQTAVDAVDISDQLTEVNNKINANTSALSVINGEGTGSIKKALADANDYTDTQILTVVAKEEGKELISTEKLQLIDTNAADIAALKTKVEANKAAVQILNGTVETTGSVREIVNTSITQLLTWQEII